MGSSCTSGQNQREIPRTDLNALSHYSERKGAELSPEQAKALKCIFPTFHTDENVKSLYFSLANSAPPKQFIDSNFALTGQKHRLSQLYHFQQNGLMSYFSGMIEDLSFFQQQNIELGYLSVVFYAFVVDIDLLRRVLETARDNAMGIYGFNFYCNGQRQRVIVDDFIPTTKTDSVIYTRIHKGKQVWPLMMEKAWCKLTGGYENALGLSPECAFEEITGIPAYTFTQHTIANFESFITDCLQEKYWVCLVAGIKVPNIENRHVFYLESYDVNKGYKICSPFMNYKLKNPKENVHRVNFTARQLLSHFQYFIVGYWHKEYFPRSIEVHSAPRQSVWLKIVVPDKEKISIRFSQYYKGYLSVKQRDEYKYSAVQMELYDDSTGKLVSDGCSRTQGNSKSVYMFKDIFESHQGIFYLRISVDWLHKNIMKGNLVIYSKQKLLEATLLSDNQRQKVSSSVYQKMVLDCPESEVKVFNQCQAEVRIFETKGQTVIVVKNIYQRAHTMAIEFCEAENVEIKNTVIRGKKAIIRFEAGESIKCLELSHANYLQDMKIGKILLTEEKK